MQDKLYGGRFEGGQDQFFEKFSESLHFDGRLIEADIVGSQAFARALESVGILNAVEREKIVATFNEILAESKDPKYFEGATDEDVHSFVIRKLKEKAGAVADKIHTGRSRNEQVSLDTRLWLRGAIETTIVSVKELMAALLALAKQYPQAVIPGYTHLRRAQAVMWPHYLLAYFEMFARDVERLRQAHARTNVLPLGSGALAGSAFPFDRHAIAKDLGFAAITRNSMDVSADRDFALDYMHAANLAMLHLSRLSEDWILYSGEEFGWLDLSDGVTSGSSLMPQKKNPDPMELVRGKAGRAIGVLSGWLATMKGLPLGYNKDLQEDKALAFASEDDVAGCLMTCAAVVRTLTPRPSVMRHAASGLLLATEVADYLVGKGVPFRTAHEVSGRIVRDLYAEGKDFSALTLADWQRYHETFDEAVFAAITPEAAVRARLTPQSTGPDPVGRALAETREWVAFARAI